MSLSLEQSTELCDQLHGKGHWEVTDVTSWSFRMVYATSTPLKDNLNKHYAGSGLVAQKQDEAGRGGQASPSLSTDIVRACMAYSTKICGNLWSPHSRLSKVRCTGWRPAPTAAV